MVNHKKHSYFLYLIIFIGMMGCYESKDGCIDARATNYDVSADQNCCCTYPNLSLGIGFFYENGEGFRTQQSYFVGDDSFKIVSLDILISEAALMKGPDSSRVDSIISLPVERGGNRKFIDDFAHLKMSSSSTTIGRFLILDTFDRLRLTIGLNEASDVNPIDISAAHPLHPDKSFWNDSTGFSYMQMTLIRGVDYQDTITINMREMNNSIAFELGLNEDLITERGDDIKINLEYDVLKWISFVDIIHDHPDTLKEKLFRQIPNVISIL